VMLYAYVFPQFIPSGLTFIHWAIFRSGANLLANWSKESLPIH